MNTSDCPFFVVLIILLGIFILLFITINALLVHHFCSPISYRYFSPIILVVVFLYSAFRITFLLLWVNTKDACLLMYYPYWRNNDSTTLVFFGTIPHALTLSILSLYIHTFTRLMHGVFQQRVGLPHFVSMLQHIVNISIYFWYALYYFMRSSPYQDRIFDALMFVTVATGLVNIIFLVLFTRLMNYQPLRIVKQPDSYFNIASFERFPKILFLSSGICFFGAFVKAILLFISGHQSGNFKFWSLPAYFIIGEITPIASILVMQALTQQFQNLFLREPQKNTSISPWPLLKDHLSTVTEEPSAYNRLGSMMSLSQMSRYDSIQGSTHSGADGLTSYKPTASMGHIGETAVSMGQIEEIASARREPN